MSVMKRLTACASVENGCWVLTHLPAGPWPVVEPVRYYFDSE